MTEEPTTEDGQRGSTSAQTTTVGSKTFTIGESISGSATDALAMGCAKYYGTLGAESL